jgi:elongation factor Ts
VGALVELNCETDFVAKSSDFTELLARLVRQVATEGDAELAAQALDGSTVTEAIDQLAAKLGEKLEIGRVVRFESPDGVLDAYRHTQSGRGVVGVLVELGDVAVSPTSTELAHDLALHIASAAPRFVSRDDVPAEEIERERGVLEAQTREEGKPEAAIGKIVDGRINGFFKQVCLLEQAFVKDQKSTVGSLVSGAGATVRRFARVKIGED